MQYGVNIVPFGDPSDITLIHTCAITEKAEKDCIRLAKSAKAKNPDTVLILAGCAVQVDEERLKEACSADLLIGQKNKFDIPEILKKKGLLNNELCAEKTYIPYSHKTRANVKVQDGCDFCCTYCITSPRRA